MSHVKKHFKCFRCHYHKGVKVPTYFKGQKCKRCNSFKYFNYIPNYRKRLVIKTIFLIVKSITIIFTQILIIALVMIHLVSITILMKREMI